ncbi:hypothetical protein ACTFIR_002288 [Dictyostelium discoideum]
MERMAGIGIKDEFITIIKNVSQENLFKFSSFVYFMDQVIIGILIVWDQSYMLKKKDRTLAPAKLKHFKRETLLSCVYEEEYQIRLKQFNLLVQNYDSISKEKLSDLLRSAPQSITQVDEYCISRKYINYVH